MFGQRFVRQSFVSVLVVAGSLCPRIAAAQNPLLDNLSFFVGPDGSKQPQDLGINANMGVRASANWGVPLSEAAKLGAQIGVGYNASDAAVHVLDQITSTSSRRQTFVTAGLFERPTSRINWGLVYDAVFEHYYDDFQISQVRGQVGFGVTKDNELGVWFTKRAKGDDGQMAGTPVRLDAISQVNAYTRHTWANAAQTMVWLGVASGHDDVVWVFPANPRDTNVIVYGAQLFFPLSEKFAVTGAANLVTPTATGTVDAYLGVAFYPGRGAMRAAHNTFAPVLPVANNPEMAINLHR
jgi:hypothetical protein